MSAPLHATHTVLDVCESTNDLARELGNKGAAHGSWISAREQTSGRGRQGREWVSREGGLFLSIVARLERKDRWTWVPLATAVAVASAVLEISGCSVESDFPIRIKWPNDLWVHGAKLGGILCEAFPTGSFPFIVVGIGLNCSFSPTAIDQKAVSLKDAFPSRPSSLFTAEKMRDRVASSIATFLTELDRAGPEANVIPLYSRWSALSTGAQIEWVSQNGETKAGQVQGLGPAGELLVLSDRSQTLRLLAEDVKLKLDR